jgi:hypothetical protein
LPVATALVFGHQQAEPGDNDLDTDRTLRPAGWLDSDLTHGRRDAAAALKRGCNAKRTSWNPAPQIAGSPSATTATCGAFLSTKVKRQRLPAKLLEMNPFYSAGRGNKKRPGRHPLKGGAAQAEGEG